jgi:hypothetical protein
LRAKNKADRDREADRQEAKGKAEALHQEELLKAAKRTQQIEGEAAKNRKEVEKKREEAERAQEEADR